MAKPGGQTKYNAARHKVIVDAIREGNPRAVAASLAGVHRQSITQWLKEGENEASELHQFFLDYTEAEAEWEAEMLKQIDVTAKSGRPNTWQAAAWRLERRWPERYGRNDRVPEGDGRQLNVFIPSPEQLPQVLKALDELGSRPPADLELEEGTDFHEE